MSTRLTFAMESVTPGTRILLKGSPFNGPEYVVGIISDNQENDESISLEVRSIKQTINIKKNALHGQGWKVVWNEAIPDIDEDRIIAIYKLLELSRYTNHAFLLQIIQDRPETATARLLTGSEEDEETVAIISREILPAEAVTDDIIIIRPKRTNGSEEDYVITEADIALTGMNIEMVNSVLSAQFGTFKSSIWPTGDKDSFELEIGHCMAKNDKDKVVVLVCDTGDAKKSDVAFQVLDRQGSKLYWNDSIEDEMYGTGLDQGIWIGTDIHWYDAGEDGAEWEALWKKANIDDLIEADISYDEIAEWYEEYRGVRPSHSEILALIDDHTIYPNITTDESVDEETVAAIAQGWIEGIAATFNEYQKPEIITSPLTSGGQAIALFKYGKIAATALIVRDSANNSILTRWLESDLKMEITSKKIDQWLTS